MKKSYIVLLSVFIIIFIIIGILIFDYYNDTQYLKENGFSNPTLGGMFMEMDLIGYDNYCKENPGEGQLICNIYYNTQPLDPAFKMNINFGDDTTMSYSKQKKGLFKKEFTDIFIDFETSPTTSDSKYCHINDDFSIIDDSKNDPFCYTEDYTKFLEDHEEYIKDALSQYNAYYDNFNMARSWF